MSVDESTFFRSAPPSGTWPTFGTEGYERVPSLDTRSYRHLPAKCDPPPFSVGLDVRTGSGGQVLVLQFSGEIDLATLPVVRDALAAVRNATSCAVVLDLAALEFCCGRGFGLLAEAADHAATAGVGFSVSGLHPHLDRMMSVMWPEGALVRHSSVADAVEAFHTERAHGPRLGL